MDCLPHLHLVAIHAERGYRSEIPGIGVLCREKKSLVGGGVYRNSVHRETAYLAAGWQPVEAGMMRLGVIAGMASGYRDYPVPIAAGFVSIGHLHLTLVPKVRNTTPATLGISFTLDLR